jgi:hypothetical protein
MTIINVSNSAQLQSALDRAAGGDTIVLAGGNYGTTNIANKHFSTGVTIKSASLSNRAHFDYLGISRSSNLNFEGLDVGHARRHGENESTHYSRVTDSDHIRMVGMSFHGSLDNNPANDGIGLNVTNSDHFQLMGSTFRDLYRGAFFQRDEDLTVASNSFQSIRTDGVNFGTVNGVVIDKNSFTDFHPARGDHADAIQFWLTGQPHGSSDIVITNNTIMQGSGVGVQGIFISDPKQFDYKNVRIENNLIYGNDQYHGIFLNGVHGAQVIGNTLLSRSNDHKMMWIDLHNGSNFVVKDNLADTIVVKPGATGVSMSHNASLDDAAWIRSLIPNLNAPRTVHDLIIDDYGYQVPGATHSGIAPVASVLGESISNAIDPHGATSSTIPKVAVAEPAPVMPSMAEIFPVAAHHPAAIGGHGMPIQPLFRVQIDHFVALP